MTWLDDLLGVKDLWSDGALLAPRRSALEFVSGTGVALALVDDPATGRSKLTISAAGGSGSADDWRSSVRVATTGALPAYTRVGNVLTANANGALPAIDGVTLTVGARRVFLWHGASGVDNGTYDVTQLGDGSSPWILTRTVDVEGNTETFTDGTRVPIAEGTTYAGRTFKLTTNDPITLNVTSLVFALDTGLADGTAVGQVPRWDGTTWTAGAVDLADGDARTGILPVANGGTGLSALGSAYTSPRVNAGATALEYVAPAVVYAPVQDWATFIALVNAQAALGRAVQMGPGTWTCDAAVALAANAHIIGGPAVVIDSTMTLTGGFAEFVFYKFVTVGAVAATLSANAVIGAKTLSVSASIAAGTRIWVGQTAGTGHTYLASQYWVQSVSGAGPYTLTLDRAVEFPFASSDEVKAISAAPDNIRIDGRGMTITGRGDRAIEFTGGWKCHVSGVNYEYDGSTNFGAFCSLDIGCLDCSVRDCVVELPPGVSAHGVLIESSEHCEAANVRVTGGSVGLISYDSFDCVFRACSSSGPTQAGMLLTSNIMALASRCVTVDGGSFNNSGDSGVLVGYAEDCVLRGVEASGNLYGIDTGTTAIRLRGESVRTRKNTNRGILSRAAGAVWIAPSTTGEASSIGVRDSCDIIAPQIADFSSYGVYVEASGAATTRVNLVGGKIASGQSGSECCYVAQGSSFRVTGTHFEMTSGAANQTAIHHTAGGPVIIDGCTASQSSASSGYVGASGMTVRWSSRADFSALSTKFSVHASGYGSVGTLVSGGAGAAQDVTWPDIAASDHITWTRTVDGGVPGIMPLCTKTAATKFTATFAAGDTSTYEWRVE